MAGSFKTTETPEEQIFRPKTKPDPFNILKVWCYSCSVSHCQVSLRDFKNIPRWCCIISLFIFYSYNPQMGCLGLKSMKQLGSFNSCRLKISAYPQNESLWNHFKLLYSWSHCRTGQSQRTLIIYGTNHQRAEQRGTKFVGAEFVCAPESRIDHCRLEVVPHVPAVCVHHTHRYRDTQTHTNTHYELFIREV